MEKGYKINYLLIWSLAGLTFTSCLARSDYNILLSFTLLVLYTKYYHQTQQLALKLMIQLIAIFLIFDLLWLFFGDTKTHTGADFEEPEINEFWNSLSCIHGFVYILGLIELLIKAVLCYFLVMEFKSRSDIKSLLNFKYGSEEEGGENYMMN